jgi:hypothetical protein
MGSQKEKEAGVLERGQLAQDSRWGRGGKPSTTRISLADEEDVGLDPKRQTQEHQNTKT